MVTAGVWLVSVTIMIKCPKPSNAAPPLAVLGEPVVGVTVRVRRPSSVTDPDNAPPPDPVVGVAVPETAPIAEMVAVTVPALLPEPAYVPV